MNVLVIERESLLSWALMTCLKRSGYEAFSAQSGREALRVVPQSPFDVIILDPPLPDVGLQEIAHTLRSRFPGAILVLLVESGAETCRDADLIDACFTKPLDLSRLIGTLEKTVRNGRRSMREFPMPAVHPKSRVPQKKKGVTMKTKWALFISILSLTAAFAFLPRVEASDHSYIGAEKCGKLCHKVEYNSWLTTKHAKAFETLKPEERKKQECVTCHITGNSVDLPGVQCEACHGPGSEYKSLNVMKSREKSMAAGLILPSEKVCVSCHNKKSPHYKEFNYAERSKKVHDVKKK